MNVEEKVEMLRKMSDEKLYEYYITARNALEEYGHNNENILKAYLMCTGEISLRYFDEHKIIDRKSHNEIIKMIKDKEK